MNQFCNKKRKREENENEDIFAIPDQNKKIKKLEFSFPQEVSLLSDFTSNDSHIDKNISFNNIVINSNSSLLSKNDQMNLNANNSFLFKVKKYDENEMKNKNFKKIELKFEEIVEEEIPIKKSKSFALEINIKRELLSNNSSFYSNSSYKDSSSHYSNSTNQDLYYPYEIGELIENQYLVSNNNFLIFIFINIGSQPYFGWDIW